LVLFGAVAARGDEPASSPSDWRAARREADDAFRGRLQSLAEKCDGLGLVPEAKLTRAWFVPRDPGRRYIFLPASSDPTQPAAKADDVVQRWHAKFREYRAVQADSLFRIARLALADHQPTHAYQLLHEALRENPDHAELRRVLALPKPDARVAPPKIESSAPKVDHPRLGWKRGQYWRAESAHLRIATNHSAAAAIDLARQLEDVYAVWRQVYFPFWSREAALAARIAGQDDPLGPSRKHDVVLFRNRDEYVARLLPSQPQIGLTLGIYLDEQRAAYLYSADESVVPTWRHEIAHQLFQESEQTPPGVGMKSNIWAAEAAALYFESLRKCDGYYTIGGKDADRLQFARYRILRGDFVMPMDELAALGRDALQKHAEIRKLYGQSAAIAHLLLDGQQGRHAEGFVDFLGLLYAGRAGPDSLFQRLKLNSADLDAQLREYLQVTDDELRTWPSIEPCRNLSLGRTAVTDDGLMHLAGARRMEWLDLSFTPTSNQGLAVFRDATKLKQLFLEQTKITDDGLATIATFRDLEELDLSHTAISNQGLAHLSALKRLQKLYLTGCAIGDEGLAHLKTLKQLDSLELSETMASPAGLADLRRALPKLGQ
jgi:hypothetical protein